MIVRKPTVIIYTRDPDEDFLKGDLCGSEKRAFFMRYIPEMPTWMSLHLKLQKILCLVQELVLQAWDCHADGKASKKEKMYLGLNDPRFWQCRNLGANSASGKKNAV